MCISRGLSNKKSVFFVKLLGAGYTRVRVIHGIKGLGRTSIGDRPTSPILTKLCPIIKYTSVSKKVNIHFVAKLTWGGIKIKTEKIKALIT